MRHDCLLEESLAEKTTFFRAGVFVYAHTHLLIFLYIIESSGWDNFVFINMPNFENKAEAISAHLYRSRSHSGQHGKWREYKQGH